MIAERCPNTSPAIFGAVTCRAAAIPLTAVHSEGCASHGHCFALQTGGTALFGLSAQLLPAAFTDGMCRTWLFAVTVTRVPPPQHFGHLPRHVRKTVTCIHFFLQPE